MLEQIKTEIKTALLSLLDVANLEQGDIFLIGCSTSEVLGHKVGTFSSRDVGEAIFKTVYPILCERGLFLAVQCCEHLNRSLIIEKAAQKEYRLERVNVVPQLHAGGAFAMAAWENFESPVAVSELRAAAGMDIGSVLIGMNLRPVAVPVRCEVDTVGQARLTLARTRPRFVGGERATYEEILR